MKMPAVQSAPYPVRSQGNSSPHKAGLLREISIQTVPLKKAAFKHAGLGLSAETTDMLGKFANYLGDNPSGKMVIRDYQNDTTKSSSNSSQARIKLVKAYLVTQGIDVPRYVIKGPRANGRLGPRIGLGTELIVELLGNHRLDR